MNSKEKMAKLERENKRLKEHLATEVENNIAELSHQLEDANNLNELLKKEIQSLKAGLGGCVHKQVHIYFFFYKLIFVLHSDGSSSTTFINLQGEVSIILEAGITSSCQN